MTEMNENDFKKRVSDRAYFMFVDGHGTSDLDRYYKAEQIETKLLSLGSYEKNYWESPMCRFCYIRTGTIYSQFLPAHVGICCECFMENTKEQLIANYTECNDTAKVFLKYTPTKYLYL